MAVGDIGHWRDSAGSQIPGTSFGGFNFASQQRNDNSTYSKPNDSTIEIEEDGTYLIVGSASFDDTSNGRFNSQFQIAVTSGSGSLFRSRHTGYSRDSSEDRHTTQFLAVYHGGSANDQLQIQCRRDTDAPTGGSIINESDVMIVRIDPQAIGIYQDTGSGSAYGGTTRNTVTLNSNIVQSDTSSIERTGNVVALKGDNKRYLVMYTVSGSTGGSRTQRISNLNIDGSVANDTQSYCYQRNSSNEYGGMLGMTIVETATADIDVFIQCYRGVGVSADQGGANVDGSWVHNASGVQLCAIELPDSLEVFRSHDSTGLQDVTGTTATTLNIMRDVDFNDSDSFTAASNTVMNIEQDMDVLVWGNVWTARNNVSAGSRFTGLAQIEIAGSAQTTGQHYGYTRGNQGSQDTFGGSWHPWWMGSVTNGQDVEVSIVRRTGGEGAGTDRTQANTAGFIAINLDTWEAAAGNDLISGTITTSSSTAGDMQGAGELIASVNTSSTTSGDINGIGELQGSINTSSSLTGTIDAVTDLSGTINGSSTVSGTMQAVGDLVGSSSGVSAVTGAMQASGTLQVTVSTNTSTDGTLTATATLQGVINTTTTTDGTLISSGSNTIDGEINTSSSLTGTLQGLGALDASISTSSSVSGDIEGIGLLQGVISTNSSVSGDIEGQGVLSGVVNTSTTTNASIGGSASLTGSISTFTTTSAIGILLGSLIGAINTSSTIDGSLEGLGQLVGSVLANTTLTGDLQDGSAERTPVNYVSQMAFVYEDDSWKYLQFEYYSTVCPSMNTESKIYSSFNADSIISAAFNSSSRILTI